MAKKSTKAAAYIVKCPVNGAACAVPFNAANSYTQLSESVGGYLECAPHNFRGKGKYGVTLFVDEEGLLKGLDFNFRLARVCRTPLAGNGVFAGTNAEGETVGLTEEDANALVATLNA